MDKGLDAHLAGGEVQMSVEEGPGLEVVEIVVGDSTERIQGARPHVPQKPEHGDHDDGCPCHHGDGEPSPTEVGFIARDLRLRFDEHLFGIGR